MGLEIKKLAETKHYLLIENERIELSILMHVFNTITFGDGYLKHDSNLKMLVSRNVIRCFSSPSGIYPNSNNFYFEGPNYMQVMTELINYLKEIK